MGVLVYLFLGTSRDVTFGPTAVMSLLTAEFCSEVSEDARIAIMLTFICGIVQIAMGLLNIGKKCLFLALRYIYGLAAYVESILVRKLS